MAALHQEGRESVSSVENEIIDYVRSFNRFYTRRIGLLEEGHLGSGYTLAEARVLYELAARSAGSTAGVSQKLLVEELNIDPGYLSRIIKKQEAQGLVRKVRSEQDGRRIELFLSPAGRDVAAMLGGASQRDIGLMLHPLGSRDREILVNAMRTIEHLLNSASVSAEADPPSPALTENPMLLQD